MEIIDKLVVLLKKEDRVFITENKYLPLDCVSGNVSSECSMWRVNKYDEYDGVLVLQAERGKCRGIQDFLISSGTNAHLFDFLHLNTIVLEERPNRYSGPQLNQLKAKDYDEETKFYENVISEPIKNFRFKEGKVSVMIIWSEVQYFKEVEIENPSICEEHESIKHYFEEFFVDGQFKVKVTVGKKAGKTVFESAYSNDIQSISEELIRKINYASSSFRGNEQDENIPPIAEIQQADSVTLIENVDSLLTFLDNNPSKHFNHLTYLSKLQEGKDFKLRTTSEPISFLFSFRTNNAFYAVWESHDSEEATYIWRFPLGDISTLEERVLSIEDLLKNLRNSKKREYKKSRKNDPDFHVIEHDYKREDHGFEKWKIAVEKYIHML